MLILLLTQSLANSCLPFACQSDSFWCLGTNATHVRTNNCKESPYINCPVEQIGDIYQNVTCKLPEQEYNYSWPGEPCYFDYDCVYGLCNQGVCKGLQLNDKCESTNQCGVGFYCADGLCKNQLAIGSKQCTQDNECVNNAGCNNGQCVKYGTLKEDSKVNICDQQQNWLCQTGFCYGSTDFYCMPRQTLMKTQPVGCSTSDDCIVSVNPLYNFSRECRCSWGSAGQSYCELFPGDYLMMNYTATYINWLTGDLVNKCHTNRRMAQACMEYVMAKKAYQEYRISYFNATQYSEVVEAQNCTLQVMLPEYYDILQAKEVTPNDDDQGAFLKWGIAMFLGLI